MLVETRGIHLNVEERGDGPSLLLLHGFLGSAVTWKPVTDDLSRAFRCVMLDLPGHGRSDAPADWARYRTNECVSDIIGVLDYLGLTHVAVLGYSMGGRVALALAAEHTNRISALICDSANPGIDDQTEREARIAGDDRLAQMIEREGMAAFVDYWESLPLFKTQERLPVETRDAIRASRLETPEVGAAGSLRGLSQGRQPSLWGKLSELRMPALIIAGQEDAKYREIALHMTTCLPNAQKVIVQEAGHTVHLEQPAAFAGAVLDFLPAESTRLSLSEGRVL